MKLSHLTLSLTLALVACGSRAATGDLRIQQQSAAGSWPDKIFTTANNAIVGTNASGVPIIVTAGAGLSLSSGTLTIATALTTVNSMAAATTTDLTLAGGSNGVRAMLGQGSSGVLTLGSATSNWDMVVNFKSTASGTDKGMTLTVTNQAAVQFALNASNVVTTGAPTLYNLVGTSATASGTPNVSFLKLTPTVNWGGTPGAGTFKALHIAVTETALPSGTNHLIAAYAGAAGTTEKFSVTNGGNVFGAGSLTTGAPAGGTAAAWKLGTVASVSATSPNRTIQVDVAGTLYYVHAKTTND